MGKSKALNTVTHEPLLELQICKIALPCGKKAIGDMKVAKQCHVQSIFGNSICVSQIVGRVSQSVRPSVS